MGRAQRAAALDGLGITGPARRPLRRLIATLPAMEPRRPDWPADAVVVGPLEWDPAVGDLVPSPGDAPLVLVSSSTASGWAGRVAKDLLEVTLEGVAGLGVRLACTRFDPYPGQLPSWAVAGPGRQAPLLEQAAVLVAGAGHGIVAKALVRGVPLVTVPGAGEQRENAARLARLGAAEVIKPDQLDAETVRKVVSQVLSSPSYRNAATAAAEGAVGLGPAYAAEAAERALLRVRV
jgi:UDP:flavonoid glycosyltransferase YjiC (YdhE family)